MFGGFEGICRKLSHPLEPAVLCSVQLVLCSAIIHVSDWPVSACNGMNKKLDPTEPGVVSCVIMRHKTAENSFFIPKRLALYIANASWGTKERIFLSWVGFSELGHQGKDIFELRRVRGH